MRPALEATPANGDPAPHVSDTLIVAQSDAETGDCRKRGTVAEAVRRRGQEMARRDREANSEMHAWMANSERERRETLQLKRSCPLKKQKG